MKKLITLCLALSFVGITNAQWKRIKGNGNVVTIERSVGDYDAIALAGWFDLELIAGNEGEITLKGESNLLDYIKTEVKDGKLVIKAQKGVNLKPSSWKSGILVVVPVESVDAVSLSGSGDIIGRTTLKSDTFETRISGSGDIVLDVEANSVEASMSGSGDMKLNGKASDLEVQVSGSGDINAYGLEADYVKVQVSGSADVEVTANESISARVSGSGDISYKGNPKKIDTKSSGSGDINSY
ncbi:head GIN domain-containing protein [Flagellimonas meridianipacifica]|uniref:Putative autotransporter adhesin-like protein n=1 Tax=Flagellimonas meridianipacifica TaxID=1080225 RepID=A0A2T0MD85_9FLAO|nr:head GIN domain-containing protein [Allomuricauda pacifica]PRX55457.1 putative autotransporter adhesin-like protein [Allomuricauda pacifica]